jgi:hypothetical protein
MLEVDLKIWALVAEGDLGGALCWEAGFDSIERARSLLCLLKRFPARKSTGSTCSTSFLGSRLCLRCGFRRCMLNQASMKLTGS